MLLLLGLFYGVLSAKTSFQHARGRATCSHRRGGVQGLGCPGSSLRRYQTRSNPALFSRPESIYRVTSSRLMRGKTLRVSSRRGALGGLDDEDWADDYHNEALRDDFEDDFDFEGTKEGEAPQTASTSELDPSSPPEAIPPHLAQLLQVPDSAIPIENAASVKFGKDIPPPEMQGRDPKSMYNAATLAYLGDAVWELFLRRSHVGQPLNLANYRMKVQRQACAEAQAKFAKNLLKGKRLNKIEESIFKWGKNSRITIPTKYNNVVAK